MFSRFFTYLTETRIELKKVNWPTRADATRYTLIVIVGSLAIAAILGTLDFVFSNAILKII